MGKSKHRPRLTEEEMAAVIRFREGIAESETHTQDYKAQYELSAWSDDGTIMNIDEYCKHHGLPREDITSYKLITHSKNPYYNTVFRETVEGVGGVDFESIINGVLKSNPKKPSDALDYGDDLVTRLIYTDTHIAMSTDIEGTALYPTPWNEDEIMDTLKTMCSYVIMNRQGDVLHIDDLGDFLDGWNGYTTRGGHKLPQNMTNTEAFRVGLEFKIHMLDILTPYFSKIICHNVCIDNHAGSFAGILNHAFERMSYDRFDNVEVVNIGKFIGHYNIGKHAFVLSHGKDDKSLKFGFKPALDSKQIEKIDHYLKHNEKGSVYKESEYIWFDKGDSHQMLFDFSSAQDFGYMNYPALSPSSEWVQSNFKKGDRGFVIQHIHPNDRNIKIIPILL